MVMQSTRPFPETMQSLLELEGISVRQLAERAARKGWRRDQSVLARLVNGESRVHPEHMEAIATALHILPETFAEYRLYKMRRRFDPSEVGFRQALTNLEATERLEAAGADPLPAADLAAGTGDEPLDGDAAQAGSA